MEIEAFDEFVAAVLGVMDDCTTDDWYATNLEITTELLKIARERLFEKELNTQAEKVLLRNLITKYGVPDDLK